MISQQVGKITGREKYKALTLHVLLIVCLCVTMKWFYDYTYSNRYFAAILMTSVKLFNDLERIFIHDALDYNFALNDQNEQQIQQFQNFFQKSSLLQYHDRNSC